ncbi:Hypothetical_protein [Hexamita inflata]|uniref:Hypothetical_protein n=1 Tax=Hexamita inflata TaxID=28002 RepID=A0AA86RA12_9EUKA|nr:Hypothetical protein HINF_LOCUS57776 [Hexamita inflata]
MKMLSLFLESFKLNQIKLHNQTAVNYLVLLENYNFGYVDVQENIELLNGYNFMRTAMFQPVFLINYSSQNCFRRKVVNLSKYTVKQTNSSKQSVQSQNNIININSKDNKKSTSINKKSNNNNIINNQQVRSQIQYTVFKNGSGTINSDFYIPAFVDELIDFLAQMQNFQTCEPKTKQRFDFVFRILNAEIKFQKEIVFFGAVLTFAFLVVVKIVLKFT